jgi:nucleotide-binding universal stress UspA family protein
MQAGSATIDTVEEEAAKLFSRLFVPIDYSTDSHRALGAALVLEHALRSAVCLFHATQSDITDEWLGGIGSPAVLGDPVERAEARLRRFADNVAPDVAPRLEFRARVGHAVTTLRTEAHRWDATLVIVSAAMRARLFRSDAERLIHDFDLPMLVIPAAEL